MAPAVLLLLSYDMDECGRIGVLEFIDDGTPFSKLAKALFVEADPNDATIKWPDDGLHEFIEKFDARIEDTFPSMLEEDDVRLINRASRVIAKRIVSCEEGEENLPEHVKQLIREFVAADAA